MPMQPKYIVRALRKQLLMLFAFLLVSVTMTLSVQLLFAQTVDPSTVQSRRAILEAELAQKEAEIAEQQKIIVAKQREKVTLERDVAILDAKVSKANLSIRSRNLEIQSLTEEIGSKESVISTLSEKIERERQSLAQLIRKTNEIDSYSLVEVVLANQDISEFFLDVDSFEAIKGGLQDSFRAIEASRIQTEAEKIELEEKQKEEVSLREVQELEKWRIEQDKGEKDRILRVTQGEEAAYQKILRQHEQDAAAIRTELFTLRGSNAIPFEKALEYANFASSLTGVRPAFILATIAEESNLGANVGTGNWKDDMHPTRDRPIFEVVTKTLGLDPDKMPVSKKPWYGWGGAIGPAQFIPSTWVCYGGFVNSNTGSCRYSSSGTWSYSVEADLIRKLTGGVSPSNPWDPKTAIVASASLMRDNGAAKGTYAAERLAALRYFAGWRNAEKPAYAFYGDDVMELSVKYQRQIDILQKS